MSKLIMTKGLPASGKSTWAKEYLTKYPNTVRVNKDDLRAMLHNSVHSKARESFVLNVRDYIVASTLGKGLSVIVDDTNFAPKHEEALRVIAATYKAKFEIKDFTDVPLKECLERDSKRQNSVGQKVIKDMYEQYLKPLEPQIKYDSELPDCYIFDIDGTLAIKGDRSPYDWSRVGIDTLNAPVAHTLSALHSTNQASIFIFSGRDERCRDETEKWLSDHKILYDELVMRPKEDVSRDSIIKECMYNDHIKGKFNVLGIFDDRNQVVEMWRSLGLPCYQVAEGDF